MIMIESDINVVIALPSQDVELWQFETISHIAQHPQVNVQLFISQSVNHTSTQKSKIFELYAQQDQTFFSKRIKSRNACSKKSLQDLPIPLQLYTHEEALSQAVNLLIVLQPNTSQTEAYTIDAQESWLLEIGHQSPAGFQEMYERTPSISVRIFSRKHTSQGIVSVLYDSSTAVHQYSYYGTLNPCLWKLKTALSRVFNQFLDGTLNSSDSLKISQQPDNRQPISEPALTPFKLLIFLLKILIRYLHYKYQCLFYNEQFLLAYRTRKPTLLAENELGKFIPLQPPSYEFWADPFLFQHAEQTYLFFENFNFETNKGKISVVPLDDSLESKHTHSVIEVLNKPYHLSYPFLFEDNGTIYMLPETSENLTVELYQAEQFPTHWKKAGNLMSAIKAHDTTLFKKDDLYWLFTNLEADSAPFNDELYIFYSESLYGEWIPHPKNPVVTQVENARSAGRIYHFEGKIIRPSQDCSVCYGYALNFNEIKVLSKTDYHEELIRKIKPPTSQGYHAIHAYDMNDDYEVIDMAKYVYKKRLLKKGEHLS